MTVKKSVKDVDDGAVSADEAKKHIESSKALAEEAAHELRLAASEKARELREAAMKAKEEYQNLVREHAEQFQHDAAEKANQYKEFAEESFSEAQERIGDYQKQGENYVRENPLKALLIALGAGFILAKIFRN